MFCSSRFFLTSPFIRTHKNKKFPYGWFVGAIDSFSDHSVKSECWNFVIFGSLGEAVDNAVAPLADHSSVVDSNGVFIDPLCGGLT